MIGNLEIRLFKLEARKIGNITKDKRQSPRKISTLVAILTCSEDRCFEQESGEIHLDDKLSSYMSTCSKQDGPRFNTTPNTRYSIINECCPRIELALLLLL